MGQLIFLLLTEILLCIHFTHFIVYDVTLLCSVVNSINFASMCKFVSAVSMSYSKACKKVACEHYLKKIMFIVTVSTRVVESGVGTVNSFRNLFQLRSLLLWKELRCWFHL